MKWKKRGTCIDFPSYVQEQTGMDMNTVCSSQTKQYICPRMADVAEKLKEAAKNSTPVAAIVDYDADGINSGAQFYMILHQLGIKKMQIIVPKRLSDGYGANPDMIKDIPDGALLFTIDNGITAVPAILEAKNRGMTVIIMDHHKDNGEVPDADIIIDPEAYPDGFTFTGYCGAGLTYKLAEELFPGNDTFLDAMSGFAAIATIADAVPVIEDNRNIVLRGLAAINARRCTPGLNSIIDVIAKNNNKGMFTEYDLGMNIAPLINAPGRLEDNGGLKVLQCMFAPASLAPEKAAELYDINTVRQDAVKEVVESLDEEKLKASKVAFIYDSKIPEGICGIIAGKVASTYHIPTFVMTNASDGTVKGSARSDGANVFDMLTKTSACLIRFGGHDYAAGFSLKKRDLKSLEIALNKCHIKDREDVEYYDFEVKASQLPQLYVEMSKVKVFGNTLPRPVIKVITDLEFVKIIGADQSHVSFQAGSVRGIAFRKADDFKAAGSQTKNVTVYGTLMPNYFRGREEIQLVSQDMAFNKRGNSAAVNLLQGKG